MSSAWSYRSPAALPAGTSSVELAFPPNCWLRLCTDGASNKVTTARCVSRAVLIAAIARIAESESPPQIEERLVEPDAVHCQDLGVDVNQDLLDQTRRCAPDAVRTAVARVIRVRHRQVVADWVNSTPLPQRCPRACRTAIERIDRRQRLCRIRGHGHQHPFASALDQRFDDGCVENVRAILDPKFQFGARHGLDRKRVVVVIAVAVSSVTANPSDRPTTRRCVGSDSFRRRKRCRTAGSDRRRGESR